MEKLMNEWNNLSSIRLRWNAHWANMMKSLHVSWTEMFYACILRLSFDYPLETKENGL